MSTEHIETVIIGAGQAGLSTAYHLTKQGRACVVLDSNARVGDNWRQHWDTLRLYTPAKYDGLPGLPFPADPWHFPQQGRGRRLPRELRAEVRPAGAHEHPGRALEQRGRRHLRGPHRRRLDHLRQRGRGDRHASVSRRTSRTSPTSSTRRSGSCTRASTSAPDDLQPGPVLVVGASHSGQDIAYEAAHDQPGHPVRPRPRPAPVQARAAAGARSSSRSWSSSSSTSSPGGPRSVARSCTEVRAHGGPMIRVNREDLAARGVERRHRPA